MKRMTGQMTIVALLAGCAPQVISGAGGGGAGGSSSRSSSTASTTSSATTSTSTSSSSVTTTTSSTGGGCPCAADELCDTGGRCITVLAAGQQYPGALALDATSVYWLGGSTSNPGGGVFADGVVMKCAVGGCNQQPTTLAKGQASPSGLAVDATSVYWANTGINGFGTDGALMKCAVGGCGQTPAVVLAGGIGPDTIAVDATRLYWTITGNGVGSVWSCPLGGCVPTKITDTVGLPGIDAVSATTLLWTTSPGGGGHGLWACAPGACMPSALFSSASSPPGAAAMDATNVYFTSGASLARCALAGCNNLPTTIDVGGNAPSAVATDGVNVYFTTTPMGPGGAVLKCAVGGCNGQPTTIAALPGISTPGSLAVDATRVYWTDLNLGLVLAAPR
jgi:hypothetical protein